MHSSDTLPTRLDLPEDRERARASSTPCRLLVADDQPDVLEALRLLLKAEGYQIDTAASPAGVVAALEDKEFDVLLMDLNYARDTTSGQEGLDLLNNVRGLDSTSPTTAAGPRPARRGSSSPTTSRTSWRRSACCSRPRGS
jgi:PleD family two-component response regulator